MPPHPMAQTVLFEDAEDSSLPHLPEEVQLQLLRKMVQWMQAVAEAINKGEHDEQDQR